MLKRCYQANIVDSMYCIVYITHSRKEALKWAWWEFYCECDFIDIRVGWLRDIDVSDLEYGVIDELEGLKRGAYLFLHDYECPKCGQVGRLVFSDEFEEFMCEDCEEERTS